MIGADLTKFGCSDVTRGPMDFFKNLEKRVARLRARNNTLLRGFEILPGVAGFLVDSYVGILLSWRSQLHYHEISSLGLCAIQKPKLISRRSATTGIIAARIDYEQQKH